MPRFEYEGKVVTVRRRKALALAAYLALAEARPGRDTIASLLWTDLDDIHAHGALRSTLSALTDATSSEWLHVDRNTVGIRRDAISVDVNDFLALLSRVQAHAHPSGTLCSDCVEWLNQAATLHWADFLAGFNLEGCPEFDGWQAVQREWLRREFAAALRRLAQHHADTQQLEQALTYAHRWLFVDVLHEPAHRLLMRLYVASGQRTEALRQYQRCVQLLEQELLVPPEEETTQLFKEIQSNQISNTEPHIRHPNASPIFVLPVLPTLIVGREKAFREIKHQLGVYGGEPHATIIVQGWPGVGKSAMAAKLAHDPELLQQFPDGILWTSLGETPNLNNALLVWADAFDLGEAARSRKLEEISAALTAALRTKRMLLIVDDIWQVDHAKPFRVGGQSCALLLTSRLNDVAIGLASGATDVYRLPILEEAAAFELLAKLTPETATAHPEECRKLVHDLEGLPLAIQVAGRLLHTEARLGWGIQNLLEELRTEVTILHAPIPNDMIALDQGPPPTVAVLLKRSTDLLEPALRKRFALLSLFSPKPATFNLAAMSVVWGIEDPRPTARIFVNRGLLEPLTDGRFQMHALLVLHARALLDHEPQQA